MFEAALHDLVTDGTISQEQADVIIEAMEARMQGGRPPDEAPSSGDSVAVPDGAAGV